MLSSAGHRIANIDLTDPNFAHTAYDAIIAYGRSKTANSLFAVGFDQRLRSPHRPLSATQNNWHNPKLLCSQWVRCFHLGQESLGWPTP
jgi:hypothetical protein